MERLIVLAFVMAACGPRALMAQAPPHPFVDYISVNNILLWAASSGMTSHNPHTDAWGLEFPKGAGTHVIFTEGLLWAGYTNGELCAGGASYRYGLQPGIILPNGAPADPENERYRIYKVRRLTPTTYAALSAAEEARLRKDFAEWPTDDGARWIDADANGRYEPNFDNWVHGISATDYPDFQGDEVLWWVANDLDSALTNRLYGTPSVGLEIHNTFWAYDEPGTLGNTVFMKHTLINKGEAAFTGAYFGRWADPDVGDPFDDFAGVDTICQVSYAYNGHDYDSVYFERPPAVGHVLLQGPIVPEAGSYAVFDGAPREGYKNQPISAFTAYQSGDALYTYPDYGTNHGAHMLYNNMQSRLWNNNEYIDPTTANPVRITLAGNPLTGDGWIDGLIIAPGDRQSMAVTGPFDLAPGDTQEVVYAVTVAQGDDRLRSVELLLQAACELRNEWRKQLPLSAPELASLPERPVLEHVYPNPVSGGFASVGFTLRERSYVALRLTNMLGQEKLRLYEGVVAAGKHTLPLHLPETGWPPGMYMVVIATKSGTAARKVLVFR